MIDWSSALWAGVAGGAAMEVFAVILYLTIKSRMTMVRYWGCMLTGAGSSVSTYVAGSGVHLVLSLSIGLVYACAFRMIWGHAGWQYGLLLGAVHWAAAGLVFPVLDRINSCVERGTVSPLKLFARADISSFLIFHVGHLIYGTVFGALYNVPGT